MGLSNRLEHFDPPHYRWVVDFYYLNLEVVEQIIDWIYEEIEWMVMGVVHLMVVFETVVESVEEGSTEVGMGDMVVGIEDTRDFYH